jgi:hypothetical protein
LSPQKQPLLKNLKTGKTFLMNMNKITAALSSLLNIETLIKQCPMIQPVRTVMHQLHTYISMMANVNSKSCVNSVGRFSNSVKNIENLKPNIGAHIANMPSIDGKYKNSLPIINAIMIDVRFTALD